jgi:hypothetical protein
MEEEAGPDWAALRAAYVSGSAPVPEICARHGVTRHALYQRIDAENWPRRSDRRIGSRDAGAKGDSARAALLASLYRRLERHLGAPSEGSGEAGEGGEAANEREARTLATLARTLEKLIELEDGLKRQAGGKEEGVGDERDIERLRAELARRFARLAESGCNQPLSRRPDGG